MECPSMAVCILGQASVAAFERSGVQKLPFKWQAHFLGHMNYREHFMFNSRNGKHPSRHVKGGAMMKSWATVHISEGPSSSSETQAAAGYYCWWLCLSPVHRRWCVLGLEFVTELPTRRWDEDVMKQKKWKHFSVKAASKHTLLLHNQFSFF
jgi:hypothetical protein